MKTKAIFLYVVFLIMSYTQLFATHVHVTLATTTTVEYFYYCATDVDSVIVEKPSNALTNIDWTPPVGPTIDNVSSIIITSANAGVWGFHSGEISKQFHVYFLSAGPTLPASMANDTTVCRTNAITLDAGNQNPGGHAATYQWYRNGTPIATTRTINALPGNTYEVDVTNACGSQSYSKTISYVNNNAPNLGPDQVFCQGASSTLNPQVNNATSTVWSTGATTPQLVVETSGTYWCFVTDNNGCNGRDTINIQITQVPSQEILLATINVDPMDPKYGNNKITWLIDPILVSTVTTTYIYREAGANNYPEITSVSYTDGEWTDLVNSEGHAWRYKIALGTDCGVGAMSPYVQTIHCWVSEFSGSYTIQWDPYIIEGKGAVAWYKILSGNELNTLVLQDSVSGNSTNSLTLPNTTDSIFVVGAELGGGKGFNGLALSNKTNNPTTVGIQENIINKSFDVFPNPAKNTINIAIVSNDFSIEITNMLGQVVLTEHNTKVLDIEFLRKGIYTISITADGKTSNKRFCKQ